MKRSPPAPVIPSGETESRIPSGADASGVCAAGVPVKVGHRPPAQQVALTGAGKAARDLLTVDWHTRLVLVDIMNA